VIWHALESLVRALPSAAARVLVQRQAMDQSARHPPSCSQCVRSLSSRYSSQMSRTRATAAGELPGESKTRTTVCSRSMSEARPTRDASGAKLHQRPLATPEQRLPTNTEGGLVARDRGAWAGIAARTEWNISRGQAFGVTKHLRKARARAPSPARMCVSPEVHGWRLHRTPQPTARCAAAAWTSDKNRTVARARARCRSATESL